ncbi:MAG: redoxin domain-containing protein [Tepidisphaeraceae bacterium]
MGTGDRQNTPDANTVVFGVNCDHSFVHAAFKKQYDIPYDLLADTSREMTKAYDMFSGVEPFNCAKRGTVVIGPDGKVKHHSEVGVEDVRSAESIVAVASA